MILSIKQVNDKLTAVDAATGQPLEWVDTVDFQTTEDGKPLLQLGTYRFEATIKVGSDVTTPALNADGTPVK